MRPTVLYSALLGTVLAGCGINPVTGKRELQFISETREIQIGQQYYSPTRQGEGGDMVVLPELTAYVNEVGRKLVAVADRQLPYEFTVLNNSVPNAWALPGGKIAVNRGLLVELKNEAELAAVLGHEIVHAAARHGAKAQERGTIMQVGMVAATIGAGVSGIDGNLAGLMIQGAGLGTQLIQSKYGREQELESDKFGMKYMKAAGYDPQAAVTLQETFVRLSEQSGQQQNWLAGLFASHPPSAERVQQNNLSADQLGRGGELGTERYQMKLAGLRQVKPAYDKLDEATKLASKKDYAQARKLAEEAVQLVPREGQFHEFLGELDLAEKKYDAALPRYRKAIELNPDHFSPYLGGGIAQLESGNKAKAEEWLTRSQQLLPTAPAAYYLGNILRERGDAAGATQYYRAASGSNSSYGKRANVELVRMDLPQNPGNYLAATAQFDAQGRVAVVVQNRSPVPLTNIRVTPVLVDATGRVIQQGSSVRLSSIVKPGEQVGAAAGFAVAPQQQQLVRVRVDAAEVAD
jgi:beta-barrel assembly-enhancing protease